LSVVLPILALAMGHVFSNAVRTLPAVAADVLCRDLAITPEELAALTSAFPAAFALAMIPVGVALDRWGVRRTSLWLFAIAVLGAALATLAPDAPTMLAAQCVLGVGCSGMLMCPMTFAARAMPPERFAVWSGVIQATGNTGMLLSASPLALLVEWQGWRWGFAAAGLLGLLAALVVAATVRVPPPARHGPPASLLADAAQVLRLAASRQLRGVCVLAFASFAAVLGVRGLWGGPWLMEMKHLPRVEAGNLLLAGTVALVFAPAFTGLVERALGVSRVALLAGSHLLTAAIILALLAGAALPAWWDLALLTAFGCAVAFQVLLFPLARGLVSAEQTGRALSAMNMFFFGGAAVMQAVSGVAAGFGGVTAALACFAVALVLGALGFLWLMRGKATGA
jgi:predicted MFS family arabinose efflux permease